MANILAYIELSGDQPTASSLHLLREGRRLASQLGATLYAFLPCASPPSYGDDDIIALLSRYGADKVILSAHAPLGLPPLHAAHGATLLEACQRFPAHLVLLPAGRTGLELGPRLAVELSARLGMHARISRERGGVFYVQQAYRGTHAVRDRLDDTAQPAVLTLAAPDEEPAPVANASEEAEVLVLPAPGTAVAAIRYEGRGPLPGNSPATVPIVVGGGAGLLDREDFSRLEQLARLLGGLPVASATACARGLGPAEWQVGLDATPVDAPLYLAFGVSGSDRHLAAIGAHTTTIAVNHDPSAAIFRVARYGLVADAGETLRALLAAISPTEAR